VHSFTKSGIRARRQISIDMICMSVRESRRIPDKPEFLHEKLNIIGLKFSRSIAVEIRGTINCPLSANKSVSCAPGSNPRRNTWQSTYILARDR
jgi:hypothetical protein